VVFKIKTIRNKETFCKKVVRLIICCALKSNAQEKFFLYFFTTVSRNLAQCYNAHASARHIVDDFTIYEFIIIMMIIS